MIGTPNIKAQLRNVFTVGNTGSNPQEVIYMQGSCRSVAWLNYLNVYNEAAGRPLRIHFMDPHDHHWAEDGRQVDCEAAIRNREKDHRLLEVLKSATIFIHEHYGYYGMFNTNKAAAQNIYQYGMCPRLDICCPNFNDRWVLFRDLFRFDSGIKARILRETGEGGRIQDGTVEEIKGMGLAALDKFYEVCRLGSFPEMEAHFKANWQSQRFFWSGNHTSKVFAQYIFRQMNERFLHLPLDAAFWASVDGIDPLKEPCTYITEYDVKAYGLTWPEQLYPVII